MCLLLRILFIPLFLFSLLSCSTTMRNGDIHSEKSKDVEVLKDSENRLIVSAEEYLNSGNLEKYFYIVNTYNSAKRESILLSDWKEQQISLIDLKLSERKTLDAVFYLNNLKAIDRDLFLEKRDSVYTSLKDTDYSELFGKYTDTQNITNTNEFTIKSYEKLLSKVYISAEYETEDGIKKIINTEFSGSGVVVTKNLILTNYHVISSVFEDKILSYSIDIEVNKEKYKQCEIISMNSMDDLAVIKVTNDIPIPDNYNFFNHLGFIHDLEIGTPIYVYSNHSGLTNTLTKGIISSTERSAFETGQWLQIDAEVTGGASGGLVLGENGLIYGLIIAGQKYENINFAIPSNTLRYNIERLVNGISSNKPWLGVKLNEVDNLVTIDYLFAPSVLKQYDIEPGSRLFRINDKDISTIDEAQEIVTAMEAGNVVKLLIEEDTYYIPLRKRPETPFYSSYYYKNIEDESYYPEFGFELDENDITARSIFLENEYKSMKFYGIKRLKDNDFLYNNGIRKDDYLGIMDTGTDSNSKWILLFHLPAGKSIKELKSINDYIYKMEKGFYDKSLL